VGFVYAIKLHRKQDKFISFDWKGPVQFQSFINSADPLNHVIVFFSPNTNSQKTDVYLFHTGWRSDQNWEQARDYFERAWTNALTKLKENLKINLQSI